jgi:hypothetical protein
MTEPTRYEVHHHPMLPPGFFYRHWTRNRGVVEAPGVAVIERERLRFVDACPPVGTEIMLEISHEGMAVYTVADIEAKEKADQEERERQEREADLRRREQANCDRAEAEAFNAALALPFRWSSAYKIHHAGLRSGGSGTGDFAKTVTHVRCDEPIAVGRLKRNAEALLCGAGEGQHWVADDKMRAGSGELFDRKVTCKACLAAAARMKAKAA